MLLQELLEVVNHLKKVDQHSVLSHGAGPQVQQQSLWYSGLQHISVPTISLQKLGSSQAVIKDIIPYYYQYIILHHGRDKNAQYICD